MKYGYSILLGEHIDATLLDYSDCKSFQIICPRCKEPVFKVRRDQATMGMLHYLSHYEKASSYAAECELRVNAFETAEINKSNALSRNQRLEYFLSVLPDSVLKNEYRGRLNKLGGIFKQMETSKTLNFMRDRFHEFVRSSIELNDMNHVYNLFDEYINEITEISGGFPKTAFSIQTQKRIAFDIWVFILSANARSNFDFMFNHSYLFLMFRIEQAMNMRKPFKYEEHLHSNMFNLIMKSKDDGMRIIASMMKYKVPPPHSLDLDMLSKMLAEIQHELFGCLLRVPYFDLLKQYDLNRT